MNCLETNTIQDFNNTLRNTGCSKCVLATLVRTKVVISRGNPRASLLIVGQNPGAEEDERGEPFVGRAGKLLDKMLAAIKLDSNRDCYLTNAALCWTPDNNDPTKYDGVLSSCRPYLNKQIELLKPGLIIAVGKPAMESLCQRKIGSWLKDVCGNLSTKWGPIKAETTTEHYPVFPIMHPAYLLRNEAAKPEAWKQLKKLSNIIQEMGIIEGYKSVG